MAHKGRLKGQRVDTGVWLGHVGQPVALAAGKLHLGVGATPSEWVGGRSQGLPPPPPPTAHRAPRALGGGGPPPGGGGGGGGRAPPPPPPPPTAHLALPALGVAGVAVSHPHAPEGVVGYFPLVPDAGERQGA